MTETTQLDPQVVAGMRAVLGKRPDATDKQLIDAYYTWHATPDPDAVRAAIQVARKPVTVADIPAGQGPASLYIGRASDGCPVLTFKDEDGDMIVIEHGNPTTPSGRAYWDHLAATLPHVTDEEDR